MREMTRQRLQQRVADYRGFPTTLSSDIEEALQEIERLRADRADQIHRRTQAEIRREQAEARLREVVKALRREEELDSLTPEFPCRYCGHYGQTEHEMLCRRPKRRAALAAAQPEDESQ